MTVVQLTALETVLGAAEPISRGDVTITYWAGIRPFVNVVGSEVTFPAPIRVPIVDGAPVGTIDLVPTGGVCCVRWDVRSFNGRLALPPRYTSIPANGPVDFGDLSVVDPATFAPADDPSIIDTLRGQLFDGFARLERITQSDYDLIPTPDPDVLYVITES